MLKKLKNWMIDSANIMFDDSKSDLRSLPKTVRLQILIVLSFIWSTVFSLYVFSLTTFVWGWAGVVLAHIGLIIAVYITFKFFHKAKKEQRSVFETGNSKLLGKPIILLPCSTSSLTTLPSTLYESQFLLSLILDPRPPTLKVKPISLSHFAPQISDIVSLNFCGSGKIKGYGYLCSFGKPIMKNLGLC